MTLFWDGGCPLCRKEIEYYQTLDVGNRVLWLVVHAAACTHSNHGNHGNHGITAIAAISAISAVAVVTATLGLIGCQGNWTGRLSPTSSRLRSFEHEATITALI